MEFLKSRSLLGDEGDKLAVILCSENKILRGVTYNEVAVFTNIIREFMLKNIKVNHVCIGLLMDKNILVPSIILSFQELNYSFVFLTKQTLTNTVQTLNTKWILTYEYAPPVDIFILEDTLQILNIEELRLWRTSAYSMNVKEICFRDIFCAMQTSGSTGDSKIVRVPHSCIEKNVKSLNEHFGLSSTDIIYWGTPLTFDPSLIEFLLGILCRATLLMVPKLVSLNPIFLYEALFKIGCIHFLQIVPSVFLRWDKVQIASILGASCLRTLAFGGESFPKEILEYKRQKGLQVFNLYGITELSCWATISNVTSDQGEVPLGEALGETFIELRVNDKVVQEGIGEIFIGSNTRYCLLNDSKDGVKFPFLVQTGDLGEYSDRRLVYRGRKTRIIKRFGHKINLHKIEESILREINLPSRLVYSDRNKKLLVFILIEEHFNRNRKIRLLDKLRAKLLKIITDTEFPDFIDVVTKFPLSEHGKICDKTLEKCYENSMGSVMPEDSPKNIFIKILDRYVMTDFTNHVETLGELSFFELGGNSILAMQVLSEFGESTGRDASGELVTLILNDSIQSCINYLPEKVPSKRKLFDASVSEDPNKKVLVESKCLNGVVWTYNLKGCVDSSPLVFKRSTETYIASGSFAHIFAVLKENGEEYLKLTLPQEIEGKPCPSKCSNYIFIGCSNGSMYCIDLCLEVIVWEYGTLQKISSGSCLCKASSAVVFGSYDNFVYCLTIEKGMLLWKTLLLGSIRADPLYSETLKMIFIGTTKGMCYALNEENGTVIWTYKIDGPIFGSPCLVNQCVVWPSVTGVLHGISLKGDLRWSRKINGNIFSSLTSYGNKIYFGCHDSRVYEVTVSDEDSRISNSFLLKSEVSSTPFVYKCENKAFIVSVCNVGRLYVIDINLGKTLLEYQLPEQCFSSPCVFNNMVYVGCRDNNLYCIDITKDVIK